MATDEIGDDPIARALERSTIAKTLKAARASLAEPSRPYTAQDRSLFQGADSASPSRPSSSYSVDQLSFVRDTYGSGTLGGPPGSGRSSRSSRAGRPETIVEDEGAYHRDGVDILRLDDDEDVGARPSPQDSEGAMSSDEELTPVTVAAATLVGDAAAAAAAAAPSPPPRAPNRPPRLPTGGYPTPGAVAGPRQSSGYPAPEAPDAVPPKRSGSSGPSGRKASRERRGATESSPSSRRTDASPRRRSAQSPARTAQSPSRGTNGASGDAECEATLVALQAFVESEEKRKQGGEALLQLLSRTVELVDGLKAGKPSKASQYAPRLLRSVLSLLDLKDPKGLFKLARCALTLLAVEASIQGVPSSGVQAAYLNVAKVLFKCSKNEGQDEDFLREGLVGPLLEVLQSEAAECSSNDLRVYVVGVLKNISFNNEANQRFLLQNGAVAVLFRLTGSEQLTGASKEAQLLIQITATLRNLAAHQDKEHTGSRAHRLFLQEGCFDSFTRTMVLFPNHTELLTNISRVLAKLTLHGSACEALAKNDAYVKQIARTLSANAESAPLTLRLSFVLGNLTAKSERLRIVFGFDCEGTALVPQLLGRYWQKDRQFARLELEKGKASGSAEVEEVLVKLVRLLANIAISTTTGSTLASSSAVVDPLLDMLGAKKIADSEELVLNVIACITNLLFYDTPSNLFLQEDNKLLLCRLFRPLLLESYNDEALMETARALGNLSRHPDARQCMAELRVDEILVILLSHNDRDLVFYVCGALVNFATDAACVARLTASCPLVRKLGEVLRDALADDIELQLVAVKVLMNLSLDPSMQWPEEDLQVIHAALRPLTNHGTAEVDKGSDPDRKQLVDLATHLLSYLPEAAPNGKE